MTWKPRPVAGPPSAWIEIAASACARFPIAARSVMQGPQPAFDVRVSTTLAPAARSRRASRFATSKVYAGSAIPVRRRRAGRVARLPQRSRVHELVDLCGMRPVAAVVARDRQRSSRRRGVTAPRGRSAATSVETASARRAMRATRFRIRTRRLRAAVTGSRGHERVLERGKLPTELLAELLGSLPPPPPEVRLGASLGEDAMRHRRPRWAPSSSRPIRSRSRPRTPPGLAVLVNANDVAVCGAPAALVPRGRPSAAGNGRSPVVCERCSHALQAAASEIGVALVGGHTEVTPAVNQPIVVGQMLGITERGRS